MKAFLSVLRQPLLLLLLLLLAAASTAGPITLPGQSPKPVSYDGVKVFRIQLDDSAEQAAQLRAVIDRLQLETWSHVVKPAHRVDVVVEPAQLAAFAAGVSGIPYTTMHDDLGASIRAESAPASSSSAVGTFRGISPALLPLPTYLLSCSPTPTPRSPLPPLWPPSSRASVDGAEQQMHRHPTCPGSTPTTPTPSTWSGCRTWRASSPPTRAWSPLVSRTRDATSPASTSLAAAAAAIARP